MASNVFQTLPKSIQKKIDDAFDSAVSETKTDTGGGGGGFVVEEEEGLEMRGIEEGLRMLDVLEDVDEDVWAVFRNAMRNWGGRESEDGVGEEGKVGKEDWRAVCAILMEGRGYNEDAVEDEEDEDEDMYEDEDDEDEEEEEDNESEYTSSPPPPSKSRRTRTHHSPSSSPSPSPSLSPAQKTTILETFLLFVPTPSSRIGIADLQRLFGLLNLEKKVRLEELVEMLDAFSTAGDKMVGLQDFERVCVEAGFV